MKELVVPGGDAVNNPEQRWNELRVPGCSRLPHFCFCFFPGMQRAEQVNRNRLRKYDVILLSYLKRDLRKVKEVTLNSHKLGFRPNIVNPVCQLNSEAIKLRISLIDITLRKVGNVENIYRFFSLQKL